MLEMYSVRPGETADDSATVKQALAFALELATSPKDLIFDNYKAGLDGYDNWIDALQQGRASDMGMRYNTGVWLECRKNAVGFLVEAKKRLSGQADTLFDEAIAHYTAVSEHLDQLLQLYPWMPDASDEAVLPIDAISQTAVQALQAARVAEALGLQVLAKLDQKL